MNSKKLQELPPEALPREKLIQRGRASLSDAELLALFLRTGVPGMNVLEMAERLIHLAGSLEHLATMEAPQINDLCNREIPTNDGTPSVKPLKGMGLVKAATLAGAFELGARACQWQTSRPTLNSPEAIFDYIIPQIMLLNHEQVSVLIVDTKFQFVTHQIITKGILNESLAHPREVLRQVILHNGYGFFLIHNHPSGDPSPSSADKELTHTIKTAADLMAIPMLDHIIIGKPTNSSKKPFYSFHQHQQL